jgi:hypothetical protein
MSEVIGSIGSESVRLRGMALEETQRQILMAITKTTGQSKGIFGVATDEAGVLASKFGKVSTVIGIVTKAGGVLADALGAVTGGLDSLVDQIRAADSGIRQSGTNLRILAANTAMSDTAIGKATSKIYKFAAEGIGQLEEQFDVYKKLSNIGGVVAGDFDNLRINASTLGVTMQEYAGLMEENFLNLRLNGTSARNGMMQLRLSAQSMRDSGEEFNDQFMRLGIGANDYGKVILQNSMMFGGLTKAQQTYGATFNDKMLQTTKTVTQLGDAFGFNREVIMKAANEALQDARNRTIFNNIREEGKQQMLSLMTGMFGGDAQKGMRATIAAYTGRFDEQSAVLAGMAPDLMQKMKDLSAAVAKGVPVMDAIKQVDLGPTFARIENQSNDLAQGFLDNAGAPGIAANALLTLQQMFGDMPAVQKRLEDSTNSLTDKQGTNLDALGRFQRENIKMAISMSMANKTLNNFGLSIALGSQVITTAMSRIAREISIQADPLVNGLVNSMNSANKTATDYINKFADGVGQDIDESVESVLNMLESSGLVNKELIKAFKDTTAKSRAAGGNTSGQTNTSAPVVPGVNASATTPQTTATNTNANQRTPARPTLGPAANALLGAIEHVQRHNANPDNEKLNGGVKFDYKINKGQEVSKEVDQIKSLMAQANLKEGSDFKLSSQYDGNTGKVGVEFMSTEAAEKYAQVASKIKNPPPATTTAPVSVAPSPERSAVVSTAPNNANTQPADTPVQVSTSASGPSQNQLNTNGTQVATLGTESDILNRLLQNNNENTTRVINKLESMTASVMMSIPQG